MSFTGFIISILVMCFIAFFICMGAVIIAIKIKIRRRKEKRQYYKDVHDIAESIRKRY